jgi:hypothetical protein
MSKSIRFRLEYVTRDFKFDEARITVSDPAKHLEANAVTGNLKF